MTDPQLGVFMLVLFVFLIMLGYPIAFTLMAMGVGFAFLAFDGNIDAVMSLLVQRTWSVMSNDVLISVPLFVFMGYVIERANFQVHPTGCGWHSWFSRCGNARDLRAVCDRHRNRWRRRDADGPACIPRDAEGGL
jgi:hypothetical protein